MDDKTIEALIEERQKALVSAEDIETFLAMYKIKLTDSSGITTWEKSDD